MRWFTVTVLFVAAIAKTSGLPALRDVVHEVQEKSKQLTDSIERSIVDTVATEVKNLLVDGEPTNNVVVVPNVKDEEIISPEDNTEASKCPACTAANTQYCSTIGCGACQCGGTVPTCQTPCDPLKAECMRITGSGKSSTPAHPCDCNYHRGGCTIATPAYKGCACTCIYKGAWTCGGTPTYCYGDQSCANPGTSKQDCQTGSKYSRGINSCGWGSIGCYDCGGY